MIKWIRFKYNAICDYIGTIVSAAADVRNDELREKRITKVQLHDLIYAESEKNNYLKATVRGQAEQIKRLRVEAIGEAEYSKEVFCQATDVTNRLEERIDRLEGILDVASMGIDLIPKKLKRTCSPTKEESPFRCSPYTASSLMLDQKQRYGRTLMDNACFLECATKITPEKINEMMSAKTGIKWADTFHAEILDAECMGVNVSCVLLPLRAASRMNKMQDDTIRKTHFSPLIENKPIFEPTPMGKISSCFGYQIYHLHDNFDFGVIVHEKSSDPSPQETDLHKWVQKEFGK